MFTLKSLRTVANTYISMVTENYVTDMLTEAAKGDDPSKEGGASNNTKGVLHELLVGKHLNGGRHMEKHDLIHPETKVRETPTVAHNRLKDAIHPKDYKRIAARASSAAEHIKAHIAKTHPGHEIAGVFHTSKAGDTKKVTGITATQKQDSSDVYISTKHPKTGQIVHHGISLKVSDTGTKHLPSSSLGRESSGKEAPALHDAHKETIIKKFPALSGKNKDQRKDMMKSDPHMASTVHAHNRELLHSTSKAHASELQGHLNSGNHAHVVSHIRDVLHAHKTPAQKAGHTFFKHTTYTTAAGAQHHISHPHKDYEHILKDPKNISVAHSGQAVDFLHKGKKFATQAHKFGSQSDPLDSLKSAGRSA